MFILSKKKERFFSKYINKNRSLRTLGTERPNKSKPRRLFVPVQAKLSPLTTQIRKKELFQINQKGKLKTSAQRQLKETKKKLNAMLVLKLNLPNQKEKKEKIFGKRRIRTLKIQRSRDVLYSSVWVQKLTNKLMKAGKKTQAERIMLTFVTKLNQISQGKGSLVFHEVIEMLRPTLSIVLRRKGRRYYQVPVPIPTVRQRVIAFRWLIETLKENPQRKASDVLLEEFIGIYYLRQSET